ncbi:MAG: hypothetical protein KAS88_04525 [Deltaproteobacteria bacterium]|nr:hypothetical protein [Deltaproteobacteria bacterium]
MSNKEQEWQKMCDDFEIARTDYFEALALFNETLRQDDSCENFSANDFDELESKNNVLEKINCAMKKFVEENS